MFCKGVEVLEGGGTYDVPNLAAAKGSPLAKLLFRFSSFFHFLSSIHFKSYANDYNLYLFNQSSKMVSQFLIIIITITISRIDQLYNQELIKWLRSKSDKMWYNQ